MDACHFYDCMRKLAGETSVGRVRWADIGVAGRSRLTDWLGSSVSEDLSLKDWGGGWWYLEGQ